MNYILILIILLLSVLATYTIDCNINPDQCSPASNLFHKNIKYGYCLSGIISENWQTRYINNDDALSTSAVSFHTLAFYSSAYLIINGGKLNEAPTGRTIAVNIDTLITTILQSSIDIYAHSSVIFGSRMYIFGGLDKDDTYTNNLYSLSLGPDESYFANNVYSSSKWIKKTITSSVSFIPNGVAYHTSVLWGSTMIIYGGRNKDEQTSDVWSVDLNTFQATLLKSANFFIPFARYGHVSAIAAGQLYIYGGLSSSNSYSDLWMFDLSTLTWTYLGTGPARAYSSMVYLPACDVLAIIGGMEYSAPKKNVLAIQRNDAQIKIVEVSTGSDRSYSKQGLAAVAAGSRVYIVGGENYKTTTADQDLGRSEIWEWI